MRIHGFTLPLILFTISFFAMVFGGQASPNGLELTPTDTHHIVELNSNQRYVAGYDVITPDLSTMKPVSAVSITVSFPQTDPLHFPPDGWLGAGMFVQDQDSRFVHVDYAFYTVLVLDAAGDLFFDIGLHQTRESSAPFQMATEELLYAYTWRISGVDRASPVTLGASWDSQGSVYYSILVSGTNITLPPLHIADLPNCENIHRQFWSGNFGAGAFPFGHFVYYFQFGVVSPTAVADKHWSAKLSNPLLLKKAEQQWRSVDLALSLQGDMSYLDYDWMWGGKPYVGVSAQYYKNPLETPDVVIFSYDGQTIPTGTVLWQHESLKQNNALPTQFVNQRQTFLPQASALAVEVIAVTGLTVRKTRLDWCKPGVNPEHT